MKRLRMGWPILVLWILLLSACVPMGGRSEPVGPPPGFNRMVRAELLFGLSSPDGLITEEKWQGFVNEVVTPRFPDGLTVFEAYGQWRNSQGVIQRERSKMLLIFFDSDPKRDQAIEEIRVQYKARFKQESVLLIKGPADASF